MTVVNGDAAPRMRAAFGTIPTKGVKGRLQGVSGFDLFLALSHRIFFPILNYILETKFGGIHGQRSGNKIVVRFHGEVDLGSPRGTEKSTRDRIRIDLNGLKEGVIDSIGPTRMGRAADRDTDNWLERPVGPAVMDRF